MIDKLNKPKAKKRGRPKKTTKTVKKIEPIVVAEKPKPKKIKRTYDFSVGRRKSAIARVRLHKSGEPKLIINNKDYKQYFPKIEWQMLIEEPLVATNTQNKYFFTIRVQGGGLKGQAESCRLGIARILASYSKENRQLLKKAKLLRRDARVKERKKFGLKRARRAPQWQKR